MGVVREIQVKLTGDNNETFIGKITIETSPLEGAGLNGSGAGNLTGLQAGSEEGLEPDPVGASSYVIAVVLIYGLSIVFLIGSHVMIKNRENHRENEKQINKFLEQAPVLKEKSAKDSYKSLKHSIIPVVALSPARDLVARRKSFASLLVGLHSAPGSRRGSQDKRGSVPQVCPPPPEDGQGQETKVQVTPPRSPKPGGEDGEGRRMSTIEEESESELDRSQAGSFKDKLRYARQNSAAAVPEVSPVTEEQHAVTDPPAPRNPAPATNSSRGGRKKKHGGHFYLGDEDAGVDRPSVHKSHRKKARSSDPCTTDRNTDMSRMHRKRNSDPGPPKAAPSALWSGQGGVQGEVQEEEDQDMWVPSPDITHRPLVPLSESPSSAETEHLLHVTCV